MLLAVWLGDVRITSDRSKGVSALVANTESQEVSQEESPKSNVRSHGPNVLVRRDTF